MDEPNIQGMEPAAPPSSSLVNIIFPLRVGSEIANDPTTGYFALAHWILPRVPVVGEEVEALGHRVKIERVLWARDGRVTVRLTEARIGLAQVEELEREGWAVQPWEDEPPSEWLK